MRILFLATLPTILLNILVWFLIHLSMAYAAFKMPDCIFKKDSGLFRTRAWEDRGRIYQRILKVKCWKSCLPDGGKWFRGGFSKQKLTMTGKEYLGKFVIETRRGELSHWLQILLVPVFFLFNSPGVGSFMMVYALCTNLPCIIAQRYNRPRMMALAEKAGK